MSLKSAVDDALDLVLLAQSSWLTHCSLAEPCLSLVQMETVQSTVLVGAFFHRQWAAKYLVVSVSLLEHLAQI